MTDMTKRRILGLAVGLGLLSLAAVSSARAETDACAGQTWPNLSEACIDQMVAAICRAGGGGSACDGTSSTVSRNTFDQYVAMTRRGSSLHKQN
jgi:hypothetical protein